MYRTVSHPFKKKVILQRPKSVRSKTYEKLCIEFPWFPKLDRGSRSTVYFLWETQYHSCEDLEKHYTQYPKITDFKCSAKSTNFMSKTITVGNEALQKEFCHSGWKPFVQFQNEGCDVIKDKTCTQGQRTRTSYVTDFCTGTPDSFTQHLKDPKTGKRVDGAFTHTCVT